MSQDTQPQVDKSLKRKHDDDNGQAVKRKKSRSDKQKKSKAPNGDHTTGKQLQLTTAKPTRRRAKEKKREEWTLSEAQGGRLAQRDPIFLNGTIITAVGNEMRVLDVEDSVTLTSLPAPEGKAILSYDALQTADERLVRILYDDGTLIDWDWTTNSIEESKPLSAHVDVYRLTTIGQRIASVFTTWFDGQCTIKMDGIEIGKTKEHINDLRILHRATIIIAYSDNAVILGQRGSTDQFTWIEIPWTQRITCFDARPAVSSNNSKDFDLVLGQADGILQLYSSAATVFASAKLPTSRLLHWHRRPVGSVKFTPDGIYLISGGEETVFVIWQLTTGQRGYLPNLTAAIQGLSVNARGDRYALKMSDNSIMVLASTNRMAVANFPGLQVSHGQPAIAARDPSNKDRLLVAVPSDQSALARPFLQTYDLRTDKHIMRQAIARTNVTDLNTAPNASPITPPDVQHMAISEDGRWLATIDVWTPPTRDLPHVSTDGVGEEDESRRELFLKVWELDEETNEWILNSRFDQPHSIGEASQDVFKLVSENGRNGFVTIGQDSVVKVWRSQRKVNLDRKSEDTEWFCRHSIALEKAQDRTDLEDGPPLDAALALSDDGSLIAAAAIHENSQVVFLLDAITGEVKSSHDNIAAPRLRELAFMDRFIIALSAESLRVWDVVQDRLHYSTNVAPAESSILAVSKLDNAIAVALPAVDIAEPSITIYRVRPLGVAASMTTAVPVAAILTHSEARGFLTIFEDATIRTLASDSVGRQVQVVSEAEEQVEDVAQPEPIQLLENATIKESGSVVEDDRTVVRREDLAKIFDVGQDATALPSVRDMFRAVAVLFARKPFVA